MSWKPELINQETVELKYIWTRDLAYSFSHKMYELPPYQRIERTQKERDHSSLMSFLAADV